MYINGKNTTKLQCVVVEEEEEDLDIDACDLACALLEFDKARRLSGVREHELMH